MIQFNQKIFTIFVFHIIFMSGTLLSTYAKAQMIEDYDITGHLFERQPPPKSDYKDTIQWRVTNPNEWLQFMQKVSKLPQTLLIDPMKAGEEDVIFFHQSNPDQLTGNNLYLSKSRIVQVSSTPFDQYHAPSPLLYTFLERERERRTQYGDAKSIVSDIKQPGIVVIYKGSSNLDNPGWVVTKKEEIEPYINLINKLQRLSKGEVMRSEINNVAYDDLESYIVYLNYNRHYADFLTVAKNGGVRATNVKLEKKAYEDKFGYYKVFKNRALNIVKSKEIDNKKSRKAAAAAKF